MKLIQLFEVDTTSRADKLRALYHSTTEKGEKESAQRALEKMGEPLEKEIQFKQGDKVFITNPRYLNLLTAKYVVGKNTYGILLGTDDLLTKETGKTFYRIKPITTWLKGCSALEKNIRLATTEEIKEIWG